MLIGFIITKENEIGSSVEQTFMGKERMTSPKNVCNGRCAKIVLL